MGAGCYYTTSGEPQVPAYWYDFDYSDEAEHDERLAEMEQRDAFDEVYQALLRLPKYDGEDLTYEFGQGAVRYGEWYTLELKCTYNGEGVLIDMDYQGGDAPDNPLAEANFEKVYRYITRKANEVLELRVASSSYTSRTVNIGEL